MRKGSVVLWIMLVLYICSPGSPAQTPEPRVSDGSILNVTFESEQDIADWEPAGNGAYSVEDGELVFAQASGDNAVDTPEHVIDENEEYVLQVDFRIPAGTKIKTPFMIVGWLDPVLGWVINSRIYEDIGDQYTIGIEDPEQTGFQPILNKGQTYTVAIYLSATREAHLFLFTGDRDTGTFLGTIPLLNNPGANVKIRIGNVFGWGSGALVIDNLMLGDPVVPKSLAFALDRLSDTPGMPLGVVVTSWGEAKTK